MAHGLCTLNEMRFVNMFVVMVTGIAVSWKFTCQAGIGRTGTGSRQMWM